MKVGQVVKMLRDEGWYLVASSRSQRQFKHPHKAGRVTVSGSPKDHLAPDALNSIVKLAGAK